MDYINTSHPNFIGGSKAVEIAQQQVKSSRLAAAMQKAKVFPFPFFFALIILEPWQL